LLSKDKTNSTTGQRIPYEEERKIIYRIRKAGKTQMEIAGVLGVS
jgi:DNA-directed RNA polymerase specialized sigma subunit